MIAFLSRVRVTPVRNVLKCDSGLEAMQIQVWFLLAPTETVSLKIDFLRNVPFKVFSQLVMFIFCVMVCIERHIFASHCFAL